MLCTETRADWQARNEKLLARLRSATCDLSEEAFNRHPAADVWSPAQVVEHLVLTNRPYLKAMEANLGTAQKTAGDAPVRYSFFGKLLHQAAGPTGNAPAPKALHPRATPIPLSMLQEWQQQQQKLQALISRAEGIDLSKVRVWNPIVRIVPMNLSDCFELLTAHTERHVAQIEERVRAF